MTAPALWQQMAHYLRLGDEHSQQFWRALTRARWSEAAALRQSFLLYASVPALDTRGLVHKTASPANLVHVLTNLEKEALITFSIINTLMEFVLGCTDKDGQWHQRA